MRVKRSTSIKPFKRLIEGQREKRGGREGNKDRDEDRDKDREGQRQTDRQINGGEGEREQV